MKANLYPVVSGERNHPINIRMQQWLSDKKQIYPLYPKIAALPNDILVEIEVHEPLGSPIGAPAGAMKAVQVAFIGWFYIHMQWGIIAKCRLSIVSF